MTNYADVPQANALHNETEHTKAAISNIDAGGTLVSFTIGMPPQRGTQAAPQPLVGTMMPMGATITLDIPASDQLMADLREWLVTRQANLEYRLANLGVTPVQPSPFTDAAS